MTFLDDFFKGAYRIRLRSLRQNILSRRPDVNASKKAIAEYAGSVQKELDFFHAGTLGTLRQTVGSLEQLVDKRHRLMVSTEFVNDYLLGKVTEEQIDKLFGGVKVSTVELDS
jgi:hypothetical protein